MKTEVGDTLIVRQAGREEEHWTVTRVGTRWVYAGRDNPPQTRKFEVHTGIDPNTWLGRVARGLTAEAWVEEDRRQAAIRRFDALQSGIRRLPVEAVERIVEILEREQSR